MSEISIEPVGEHVPTVTQPQNPFYLDITCSCGGYVYVFMYAAQAWWREHTEAK